MNIAVERRAIETTYTDTCTVYGFEKTKKGSITNTAKVVLYGEISCALSQKTLKPTNQTSTTSNIYYDAKLFVAPEVIIPSGSSIEVRRMERVFKFKSSGEPFLYETHQEIMLQRDGKA